MPATAPPASKAAITKIKNNFFMHSSRFFPQMMLQIISRLNPGKHSK